MQYAERLLSTKTNLSTSANAIARRLVYEYKDHGFVTDRGEATSRLGTELIVGESPEIEIAEALYRHFDIVNFPLGAARKKPDRYRKFLTAGSSDA